MGRVIFDSGDYHKEKVKLIEKEDGVNCIWCGEKLSGRKRRWCSDKCRQEFIDTLPDFKDWNNVRREVLERDNHTCQSCGKNSYYLIDVHHIKPIQFGGEEFNSDNCITLCRDCHLKTHRELKIMRVNKGEKPLTEFT